MPLRGHEVSERRQEIYRRLGVSPFILGKLKGAALQAKTARKLLAETPPWDVERRRYLMHVIEEGERARKYLEEYLRKIRGLERELLQEEHRTARKEGGGEEKR